MSGSRKLSIEIVGDAKGLSGAFGDAEKAADGFGTKLGGAAKVTGVAMLGIAGGAIAMIPGILETGLSLDALAKKSEVVFGDSLGDVKAWAKENASAMGLTQSEATGAAAALADLLKPMGFTSEAAADMSTDMLDLSGALSAWTGGTKSATEVSDILTKAMLGETDGLKALGISISAADVSARLAAKGQDELTGAAREQAEALAVQELIMEKSTDAQDAWASGAMDGVKAQNEQKASMQQLQESLVTALYPALQAIVPIVTEVAIWLGEHLPGAIAAAKKWFQEDLLPVIETVFGWLRDNVPPIIQTVASFVTDTLVPAFQSIWSFLQDNVLPIFQAVALFLKDVLVLAFEVTSTAVSTLWGWFQTLWERSEGLRGFLAGAFTLGVGAATTAFGLVSTAVSVVYQGLQDLWERSEGLRGFLAGAFTLGVGAAKWVFDILWGSVEAVYGKLKELWDRSEGLRSFLAAAFTAGIATAMWAFDLLRSTVEKVYDWVKDLWDRSEEFRVFLVGAMKTGIETAGKVWDGFKTTLGGVLGVLESIYSKAKTVIDVLKGIAGGKDFVLGNPNGGDWPDTEGGASGIDFWKGGPVWVGEKGPELLNLPRGSQILSNPDSMAAMRDISGGGSVGGRGGITVFLTVQGNAIYAKDLVREVYDGIVSGQRRGELVGSLA